MIVTSEVRSVGTVSFLYQLLVQLYSYLALMGQLFRRFQYALDAYSKYSISIFLRVFNYAY